MNNVKGKEFDGKIYMRKQQNDFGWDWSPAVAPAGPWRPAYLVQKIVGDPVVIDNTLIDIYRQGQVNNLSPDQAQPWMFNVSIDYLGTLPKDATLHLSLADSSGTTIKETKLGNLSRNSMTITGNTTINDNVVALWWPNGMGDQTLYYATITINSGCWSRPATIKKRVGFRTIVLNLSPITPNQLDAGIAPGSNWHFEINGKEMYAKGANMVPADVFWPRVNGTKMMEMFELVVEANQNVLRVWSSGAYLSDEIYDLADEMGILLWSEFQFSDAEYPVIADFLANYEAEAYYNIRRINHHPSLALWAGGNELEQVILAFFNYPGPVMDGYLAVFLELLIKCVYANTRSISYIPSSTYHGYTKLDFSAARPQTPRWTAGQGTGAIYANSDSYNGNADQAFNFSQLPVGRFATEFGSISMPSIHSWRDAIPESQLSMLSPAVLHHNRHVPFGASGTPEEQSKSGMYEMTSGVNRWYPVPDIADPIANFSAWCWTTQVYQADKYANEIAFYRRGSARRERQLGALFWQLNDLWVAPTWAAIEASGRQKVMYYSTKDIFSPVIVWPFYDQDKDILDVWAISDRWQDTTGEVLLRWIDWTGEDISLQSNTAPSTEKLSFTVGSQNGTIIKSYSALSKLIGSNNTANALLSLSLTSNSGDEHSSWTHIAPLGKSALRDPMLKLSHSIQGQTVKFTVKATYGVAAWVWLDHPSTVRGYFDVNGFWLDKGESKEVVFKVWNDFTGDKSWVDDVTVRSIWDNRQK